MYDRLLKYVKFIYSICYFEYNFEIEIFRYGTILLLCISEVPYSTRVSFKTMRKQWKI